MRVLFVNPAAELGGSERSLLDLLASFRRSALPLEPKLLLFADGELAHETRKLGVDVEVVPMPPALMTLGEFREVPASVSERAAELARAAFGAPVFLAALRRVIRAFRPTLLHTNGMKAHLLGALSAPELPRVVHLRDFVSGRPLSRHLLPLVRGRALFVTNSHAVEMDALSVSPALRTRVLYNGIDLDTFRPRSRDCERLAALAGLGAPSPDAVVIGLVATYAWWKGHRTFLEAAARVRAAVPSRPLRFYIVGGPVYRTAGSQIDEPTLREAIEQGGLGHDAGLVPFQNDVASAYQGLDVVVHASERPEPFGRTIVEAMACGRAVVVARAGGAEELFTEGRNGVGFRPGDAADLARVLLELVRDEALRAELARAGRENAVARFGRDRLAPEAFAAYEELVGTRRVAPFRTVDSEGPAIYGTRRDARDAKDG